MEGIRLLVADPKAEVRATIKTYAALENYGTDEAADGITAIKLLRRDDYHVVVMDTALPELDAWHVCRQIRKSSSTPIIMMSDRDNEEEKLSFFDIGVDDFVKKPFSGKELMARIRVMLRRSPIQGNFSPRRIVFSGLCIDSVSRAVYIDGESILLTPKEYSLLCFLAQNPDKALSREAILNEVWGEDFFGTDRTVDTHIKMLRENIKPYHRFIETVWGYGYMSKRKSRPHAHERFNIHLIRIMHDRPESAPALFCRACPSAKRSKADDETCGQIRIVTSRPYTQSRSIPRRRPYCRGWKNNSNG
jgi:DNA-binding response OmpR family regulator